MHALLRADGGPTIGYGHLMRMLALTEALQAGGHQVHVAAVTPAPARSVLPDAVTIHLLPTRDGPVPLLACVDRSALDVVVTDAYPIDEAYQRAMFTVILDWRYTSLHSPTDHLDFARYPHEVGISIGTKQLKMGKPSYLYLIIQMNYLVTPV